MRTSPLLADFIQARGCKPKCEKSLTLPFQDSHIWWNNGAVAERHEERSRNHRYSGVGKRGASATENKEVMD